MIEKAKQLPSSPGCYLYKDCQGRIIYVGKSKCLRKRVSQYFTGIDKKEKKLKQLVKESVEIDYILTDTEIDALLLECKLIKLHQPYYNVAMKKNKQRCFLCVNMSKDCPGIYISLTVPKDATSFGSFANKEDAQEVLLLMNSIWMTPICGRAYFSQGQVPRPCLNHHLGKCDAPCQCMGDSIQYKERLKGMVRFLRGQDRALLPGLKREMLQYSDEMEFEKAAIWHRRIQGLEKLLARAKKCQADLEGRDYCVFLRAWKEPCFYLVYVHNGQALIKYRMQVQVGELVRQVRAEALVQPGQEEGPVQPEQAEEPVRPVQEEEPVRPVQAEEPVQPEQEEEPVQPEQTEEPVWPGQAGEPVRPMGLECPEQPTQLSHLDITTAHIHGFIEALLGKKYNIALDEKPTFAVCLVSISADKLYLDITNAVRQKNKALLVKKLQGGCREFMGEGM